VLFYGKGLKSDGKEKWSFHVTRSRQWWKVEEEWIIGKRAVPSKHLSAFFLLIIILAVP